MSEQSKKIVDEYTQAREESDYATQAGILAALLQAVLGGGVNAEIARDTAEACLQARAA